MFNLRSYLPALIFAVGYLMVSSTRAQRAVPLAEPLDRVLQSVPGYEAQDQKIADEEVRVAGMSSYVARVYSQGSTPVFATLVSYYDRQTRGKSIHSPRNCLPGAGWEILSGGTQSLNSNGSTYVVNRYVLKKGPSRAIVYYWYQGRGRVVASEYRVKWDLLRDAALRGHTEEALVRVVVPVRQSGADASASPEAQTAEASAIGKTIAARMISEVGRVLPRATG